jgi:hypothetical protein
MLFGGAVFALSRLE